MCTRSGSRRGDLRRRCSVLRTPTCTRRSASIPAPDFAGEHGCPARGSVSSIGASARAALAAMGSRAGVMPVIVFHGDRDGTIPYRCGQQALAQWVATDDLVLQREHGAPLPSIPTDSSHPGVAGERAYDVLSYAEMPGARLRSSGLFTGWASTGPAARPIRRRPGTPTRSAPTRVRSHGHSSPTGGGPGARRSAASNRRLRPQRA